MRIVTILLFAGLSCAMAQAQEHNLSAKYVAPSDPLVAAKLAQWKQLKFGLLMHWGTYSQWGIVESWSLCPEDENWCIRRGPFANDWFAYKKAYEGLQQQFNPVLFNPDKWADAAATAGMKYMVFTTKHHDGFCMFDSKYTDYRITHSSSPFSTHPKANVAKEVFDAFRKKGFMIGAYFSKPDWHTPDYWWRYFPPKDRNVSYNPAKYPERWNAYKTFTHNQMLELATGYGPLDIFWLDGGWVRPKHSIDTAVEWQRTIPYDQDIDIPAIAAKVRQHQPGMLFVDRTVPGEYENYATPEQSVPNQYLPYPWESCMTLGNSWSHVPNDEYKPARKVIHLLTTIVSRNGSLLLNVGPRPDGEWDSVAYQRLQQIGSWMQQNGSAIYATEADPQLPSAGPWVFTKKTNEVFAIYQVPENETAMPATVLIPYTPKRTITTVQLLGSTKKLSFTVTEKGIVVNIPKSLVAAPPNAWAWVFQIVAP